MRPNELTMPSSRKVHNNTWLWRNPVEFPWFFVKNVLISTAVSDVDLLPADQNMADSPPACFLQPQCPPPWLPRTPRLLHLRKLHAAWQEERGLAGV